MSDITDTEWQLLVHYYGDLAYEEPHNHQRFLDAIYAQHGSVNALVDKAMEIMGRVPDVPPDPGDEMPE